MPTRSKNPGRKGWQHDGHTADEAIRHAGNVGLLCGHYSNGLIVLDADHTANALETQFPILSQTIKTYRRNAPDRAKWIVRISGELPISKKNHDAGIEILADASSGGGTNAVIFGIHDSGAYIESSGSAVVSMTAEDVAEIWKWRTGTPLIGDAPSGKARKQRVFSGGRPTPTQTGVLPDVPEVRRFNNSHPIEDMLLRAGCRHKRRDRWIPAQSTHDTDSMQVNVKANHVYAYSPKNPCGREGLIRPADIALQVDFGGNLDAFLAHLRSDGVAREGAARDRLYQVAIFGEIEPLVRKRLAFLAERDAEEAAKAAAKYAENPTDQTERFALAMLNKADKAAARVVARYWPEANLRRMMVAILDKFEHASGKYDGVTEIRFSSVGLAAAANMGRNTVERLLTILEDWFVHIQRESKRAPLFRLSTILQKVPVMEHEWTAPVHSCSITGTLALCTHYDHDAVCATMTPLENTPENRAHVAATAKAIREGTNVQPKDGEAIRDTLSNERLELRRDSLPDEQMRRRLAAGYLSVQQSRLAASIPSVGQRGLLLLTHLQAMGGVATGVDLCARMKIKKNRLSELVAKLAAIGIVYKPNRSTVAIVPDWENILDERVEKMPTIGSKAVRTVEHIDLSIAYQEHRMEEAFDIANQNPAEVERMKIRIEATQKTLDTKEEQRKKIEAWATKNLPAHKVNRILRKRGTPEQRQLAEHKQRLSQAGRYGPKDETSSAAKQAAAYQASGLDKDQIKQALIHDGFTPNVVASALQIIHRYQDSPLDPPRSLVWRNGKWVPA